MSFGKGSLSGVYWKEQTTAGVAPTGNWFSCPVNSETLGETIGQVQSQDIRPDRANPGVRGGNLANGGGLVYDMGINRMVPWMRHFLAAGNAVAGTAITPATIAASTAYSRGTYVKNTGNDLFICVIGGTTDASVTGTTLNVTAGRQSVLSTVVGKPVIFQYVGTTAGQPRFTHTLNGGAAMPAAGLAFEKQLLGGDASLITQFLDCRLNTLEITIPQEGIATVNWGVLGMTSSKLGSTGAGTPVALTNEPRLAGYDAYCHINDDAGSLRRATREASINGTNSYQEDIYVHTFRERADLVESTRVFSGRISMYFADAREYDMFKGEVTVPLAFSFISPTGLFFKLILGECKLSGDGLPKINGAGVLMADFDFTAFKDSGANDVQLIACTGASTY